MNKAFILEKGERALFSKSLDLVKTMYNNEKYYDNQYKSLSFEDVFKAIVDINVFKYLYIENLNTGKKKYFNFFKELYLFIDKDFAYEWENDFIWDKESIDKNIRLHYSAIFDSASPSSLYMENSEIGEALWEAWYAVSPMAVIAIIDFSLVKLGGILNDLAKTSVLARNVGVFSKVLSLTEDEQLQWYALNATSYESEFYDNLLKTHENGFEIIFKIIAQVLSKEENFLLPILKSESHKLKEMGVIKLDKNVIEAKIWKGFYKNLNSLDTLLAMNVSADVLFKEIVFPLTIELPEKVDFSHVQELQLLRNIISKNNNDVSILVEGEINSGKKTLIAQLCKESGVQIYEPKNENLTLVKLVVKSLGGLLLLEHKDDTKIEANNFFTNIFCNQVVITKGKADYIKNVDLVVKMNQPNLKQRIEVAKHYFEDENTVIKVSQRLKSISQIYQVYKVCKKINDFSWKHISLLISNINSVKLDNGFKIDKWEESFDVVDFSGSPHLKKELSKIIDYFNEPAKFLKLGSSKKGIFLSGPSGTGKTHFIKNLAKNINIPVYYIESSMLSNDVKLIQQTFDFLRTNSPCVLFIDEIDVLISSEKISQTLAEKTIINSLLTNMDGLESNEGVLIIGATHRISNLESAAFRSGRFDTVLTFTHPSLEERLDVWNAYLKERVYDKNITLEELGLLSNGFSCADIAEAVNKAALMAAHNGKREIDLLSIKAACELIYWGETVPTKMTKESLLCTSYHEAGHVIATFHSQKYICDRVMVKPKKNSLGLTSIRLEEGDYDKRVSDIYKEIQICFGGLVAEELIYGEASTGVSVDMKNAYFYAEKIIGEFSMHPSFLGGMNKDTSDKLKMFMEDEVQKILACEYENTKKIMEANKDLLVEIALKLFNDKEISGLSLVELSKKIKIVSLKSLFQKESLKLNDKLSPQWDKGSLYLESSKTVHKPV